MSILGQLANQVTASEFNLPDGNNENVFISLENDNGILKTYNKVVSTTGRVPVTGEPGKSIETITIERTLRTEL